MRRFTRNVLLSLCGLIGVIVAVFNPAILFLAMVSIVSLVLVFRQLNIFRIVMQIKRFVQTVSKLRAKFRGSLRMGFRDYSGLTVEDEESNLKNSHCGFMR